MDCELLGMYHKLLEGIDLSEEAMAMESLRTVEPGGHHLGTPHTMEHFRTAFFRSDLFDYDAAEEWEERAAKTPGPPAQRARRVPAGRYNPPELNPAIEEELTAFMEQRKAEINA